MANHYRISPKFWVKAHRRGWGDEEKTLALYLLTCPHRNLEGLYRLPIPYVAADLGWPSERVELVLGTLCEAGFAMYDEDAEIVLIPKALKHQAPSTERQVKGAISQLERIPRTSLWDAFRMACESHCESLSNAINTRWPPEPVEPSNGAVAPNSMRPESHTDRIPRASRTRGRAGASSSSSSSSNSNSSSITSLSSELDVAGPARLLFEFWQSECGHPQARLTRDRLSKIQARLREGYTEENIREAIRGAARGAFVNEAGKRFDDIELICRSGSKLESFVNRRSSSSGGSSMDAYQALKGTLG